MLCARARVHDIGFEGPNGFVREFSGRAKDPESALMISLDIEDSIATVAMVNPSPAEVSVTVLARSHPSEPAAIPTMFTLAAHGGRASHALSLSATANWYDITVTAAGTDFAIAAPTFRRRFAGHHEDGYVSTSDPWMGLVTRPETQQAHPDVPPALRHPLPPRPVCDGAHKDACTAA